MSTLNYYRIKTDWISEKEDGQLAKIKTEELVYASCYSEAEQAAYALIEKYDRTKYGSVSFEIIKTKIEELLWNANLVTDDVLVNGLTNSFFEGDVTSGIGLYSVKVLYTWIDEKTAKEKHQYGTIFTPAESNANATQCVLEYLKEIGETRDYTVRDARFDKAEAVLLPPDVFAEKSNSQN